MIKSITSTQINYAAPLGWIVQADGNNYLWGIFNLDSLTKQGIGFDCLNGPIPTLFF